jgi:hypothetical protein
MKRIALLLLVLVALSAGAETLPEPTGPGDLVLPPIVLEVEDLAAVRIEARLPPEEELVPPDRRFPLPEPGALPIGEPSLPSASTPVSGAVVAGPSPAIETRAEIGAGVIRDVTASVSLATKTEPGLEVSFRHDSLDGFGSHPPGSGFDLRDDRLSAAVQLAPWGTDLTVEGTWREHSRGLQGLGGAYEALTVRSVAAGASIGGDPLPWLSLAGGLDVASDEMVLAGPVPSRISETGVSPSVSATASLGAWTLGLAARYDFHAGTLIADPFEDGHRFRTDLSVAVEAAPGWLLDAAVGWHWTGEGMSAFPFHVGMTGTPLPFLTFAFRGGYQATGIDLGDVLAANALLLPAATVDSAGWFGSLDLTLGVGSAVSATAGLSYARASDRLDAIGTADPGTGLYPVVQRATDGLTLTGGFRWSIAAWLTLSASLVANLPDRPWYEPAGTLNVELAALESSGRMGATLSAAGEAGSAGIPLPRVDLGGFFRVSPAVRLRLDTSDLFAPLAGPRIELGAFERPGLRVIGTVQLEF